MPGNLVRLCSLPKFELVSCKEDFFIVDIFEYSDSSNYASGEELGGTLATTLLRTATVPTATRRMFTSTTAKE